MRWYAAVVVVGLAVAAPFAVTSLVEQETTSIESPASGATATETAVESATTTGMQTERTTTEAPSLDLREANVVGVDFEAVGDGRFDVSVTLYHDDDGEAGYANWWQVETPNGTELGRRDLLHAHGTEPFTRSTEVAVPGNISLVVVRGHDQTHGYGGQAMVVDVETGGTEVVEQGPNARDVSDCEVVRQDASTTDATGTNGTDLVDCPWDGESPTTANRTA